MTATHSESIQPLVLPRFRSLPFLFLFLCFFFFVLHRLARALEQQPRCCCGYSACVSYGRQRTAFLCPPAEDDSARVVSSCACIYTLHIVTKSPFIFLFFYLPLIERFGQVVLFTWVKVTYCCYKHPLLLQTFLFVFAFVLFSDFLFEISLPEFNRGTTTRVKQAV